MRCVNVKTPSSDYSVVIGDDLLNQTGPLIRECVMPASESALVVSDDIVWELYGKTVAASLEKRGFSVLSFVFTHGEESKNAATLVDILEFAAAGRLTKSDIFIALGGGVVGDITGLAASMYLRGVKYVQIPTTVLAAVDSSVGGKCAVDLAAGKNLAGAFWQPSFVICDYSTLDTLDSAVFTDGCAEIIKYGVIGNANLFESVRNVHVSKQIESVISQCVMMKRDIVSADERDTGVRQLLNFGHTAAHAIEKCSGYRISHGSAVAVGMVTAAKAAEKMNICEEADCSGRITEILKLYGLPTECGYTPPQLCEAALSDKKRSGGTINLVLPKKIGECVIHKTAVSDLIEFFNV